MRVREQLHLGLGIVIGRPSEVLFVEMRFSGSSRLVSIRTDGQQSGPVPLSCNSPFGVFGVLIIRLDGEIAIVLIISQLDE